MTKLRPTSYCYQDIAKHQRKRQSASRGLSGGSLFLGSERPGTLYPLKFSFHKAQHLLSQPHRIGLLKSAASCRRLESARMLSRSTRRSRRPWSTTTGRSCCCRSLRRSWSRSSTSRSSTSSSAKWSSPSPSSGFVPSAAHRTCSRR